MCSSLFFSDAATWQLKEYVTALIGFAFHISSANAVPNTFTIVLSSPECASRETVSEWCRSLIVCGTRKSLSLIGSPEDVGIWFGCAAWSVRQDCRLRRFLHMISFPLLSVYLLWDNSYRRSLGGDDHGWGRKLD